MTDLNKQAVVPSSPSYRLISLTKGVSTAVDIEMCELVNQWRWHLSSNGKYARREVAGKDVYLHHVLLPPPKGKFIDHWNGDTLDNRRCNLRIVNKAENTRNCALRRDNSSGVTGVQKNFGRWYAGIRIRGKWKNVGSCLQKEDAIQTRWNAEFIYYREHSPFTRPALIDRTGVPEKRAGHQKTIANASGITHIVWNKPNQKWVVIPRYRGRTMHVGCFLTLEDARRALTEFWKVILNPV